MEFFTMELVSNLSGVLLIAAFILDFPGKIIADAFQLWSSKLKLIFESSTYDNTTPTFFSN